MWIRSDRPSRSYIASNQASEIKGAKIKLITNSDRSICSRHSSLMYYNNAWLLIECVVTVPAYPKLVHRHQNNTHTRIHENFIFFSLLSCHNIYLENHGHITISTICIYKYLYNKKIIDKTNINDFLLWLKTLDFHSPINSNAMWILLAFFGHQ